MDLTRHVDELQRQLSVAAAAGGDDARELAARLTAPLDAAARLVLLDALSTAAGEISAELAPGAVDVRLRGGEPEFVVTQPVRDAGADAALAPAPPQATAPAPEPADSDPGTTTRTTLRLPDHLKVRAEAAAARDGVSVNTWLVRAVAGALDQPTGRPEAQTPPGRPGGTRLTGWVR